MSDKKDKEKRNRNDKKNFAERSSDGSQRAKPAHEDDVRELREDIIEGRNPVMEAIKSGRSINKILIVKGEREGSINYIVTAALERKIVVQEVDRAKLDSLSLTGAHQGVIAFVSPKDYVEVEDILAVPSEKGEDPFILILDGITDPHNLGAILRTADAAGVHGVIIPKRRAIGLTAAVAKASAGAIEYVPVARVTNLSQTIDYLKKQNIWVIGTDAAEENKTIHESDLKGPIALVIGSEGDGLSRLVKEKCDITVRIPMKGNISSLNASVAAAVVMYEVLRQRVQSGS
ncbi:MAG TPA: 23S rRNA (guanosine(2251)-2'-O)-methyltransferase RlmB [Clostridiaceae bacterium]|nr:23S rRNA (guanosine(2251)-2'-O)-methyltransferase RlmB [Clostridiaceae bacterium]